jgi:hypothetical protein
MFFKENASQSENPVLYRGFTHLNHAQKIRWSNPESKTADASLDYRYNSACGCGMTRGEAPSGRKKNVGAAFGAFRVVEGVRWPFWRK